MSELLDPWDDAACIAEKMKESSNRLIVVIGAENWCEKCRNLRPHFEELARRASNMDIMLWFDLEDHQEFLGQYIPESLPEVLIYRGVTLVARCLLAEGSREALLSALSGAEGFFDEAPPIARRLAQRDWAE